VLPSGAGGALDALPLELVGEEPVAERQVVRMGIEELDDVRVVAISVRDGLAEPGVVGQGLRSEAENPAGQPHGMPSTARSRASG
jgi:hypothetical protein